MRIFVFYCLFVLLPLSANAQNSFTARLKDSKSNEPLIGAVVSFSGTSVGGVADADGIVFIADVPSGKQILLCRIVGYKAYCDTLFFPLKTTDTTHIRLEADNEEMEEFVVSSTRSSRTIQDVATRIELVAGEELDEKSNMKPGDIKMVLSESTGIQTLQTSATSGNTGIRIEGMDGRYTQVLKDGFPLYAGFSGGLGLLQTPPLDLKRVEIIKGASSTLYGGGAIAGLINLISKTPGFKRELRAIINGTTAGGFDAGVFYGKRKKKVGMTIYAAYNANAAYAPDTVVFTAIPKFDRYTLSPKFFWYPDDRTTIVIGVNGMYENRKGGDINYLKNGGDSVHSFYEGNKTERINSTIELKRTLLNKGVLTLKNSIDHFNRITRTPYNIFDGTQAASFSEASYAISKKKLEWVGGLNAFTDIFLERQLTSTPSRNYRLSTYGAFLQNTWDISKSFILEAGLRTDYVNRYGWAVLPKISLLFKHGSGFSSRLGGGMGYKAPTIFTEESERISYHNVLPINADSNKLERSYGANWDVNYKTTFAHNKIVFSVNQLFFITHLENPLLLSAIGNNIYRFENLSPPINARGAETNIKIGYGHFKLFLGYTYTHSHTKINTIFGELYKEATLTPRNHTNTVLMYEVENKWKLGLEAYYYSEQRLSDGTNGKDYWLCGFMAERLWKKWSVFINFENMLDSRQTRYDAIYTGTVTKPVFRDIYAPLDGFIANGGIKLNL